MPTQDDPLSGCGVGETIRAAGGDSEGQYDEHMLWAFSQLLDRLNLDDFTPREVSSMIAILASAHSRKLTRTRDGSRRILRLVPIYQPRPPFTD